MWQVGLAVERGVETILRWSWWRRWHQAWARYHHYRRRKLQSSSASYSSAAETAPSPETDMLSVVWQRLEPLLPPARRTGRPYAHHRRTVLEAIVYVMQTGCAWNQLPKQFPPWQTVYAQLVRWRKTGIWDQIWAGLDQPQSTNELQL